MPSPEPSPTLAFLTIAGSSYGGATIRDMRLARTLHRRGYRVVVYWVMGSTRSLLGPGIPSRQLVSGVRYLRRRPLTIADAVVRTIDVRSEAKRHRVEQRLPAITRRAIANAGEMLSSPETKDPSLVRAFETVLLRDRVTHLQLGMGLFGTLSDAVVARGRWSGSCHFTFQGDDMLLNDLLGSPALPQLRHRLAEIAARPLSFAVSHAYARTMEGILSLPQGQLAVLYPGLEPIARVAPQQAQAQMRELLPGFDLARPLVSYVGRVDTEKGIDLFLYAMRILQERGLRPQIAVGGSSVFGIDYERTCIRIARQMELPVHFTGTLSDANRDALFAASRCVVYPSIHTEGFGMVAPEAMSQGTPVVVPNRGGLVEAVSDGASSGGLVFEPWNSGDLARQIEALLTDDALHARLSAAGPALARRFDVDVIADQLLEQIGLPKRPAG